METHYRVSVVETQEIFIARDTAEAVNWMRRTQKIANIWGGIPTFEVEKITVEKITVEKIFLNHQIAR